MSEHGSDGKREVRTLMKASVMSDSAELARPCQYFSMYLIKFFSSQSAVATPPARTRRKGCSMQRGQICTCIPLPNRKNYHKARAALHRHSRTVPIKHSSIENSARISFIGLHDDFQPSTRGLNEQLTLSTLHFQPFYWYTDHGTTPNAVNTQNIVKLEQAPASSV